MQNESFPNFSTFRPEFCPEFCSEFSPNFSRTFRASFRGKMETRKNSPRIPKFPSKHEKNSHKILLESRQSKNRIETGSKSDQKRRRIRSGSLLMLQGRLFWSEGHLAGFKCLDEPKLGRWADRAVLIGKPPDLLGTMKGCLRPPLSHEPLLGNKRRHTNRRALSV